MARGRTPDAGVSDGMEPAKGDATAFNLRRLRPGDDFMPVLQLVRRAFAYMDARIDPPSSIHRMTVEDMHDQANMSEVWVVENAGRICASITLTPKQDRLYIGKMAVEECFRGQGLARRLVDHADARARSLGLPLLELQSRVELFENHALYGHLGFAETGRTAHHGYTHPTTVTFQRPVTIEGSPTEGPTG